jgi:hypothetical protein
MYAKLNEQFANFTNSFKYWENLWRRLKFSAANIYITNIIVVTHLDISQLHHC